MQFPLPARTSSVFVADLRETLKNIYGSRGLRGLICGVYSFKTLKLAVILRVWPDTGTSRLALSLLLYTLLKSSKVYFCLRASQYFFKRVVV